MSVETTASTSETATPVRTAHHRHYLMCKPSHFTVNYSINPWMEPAKPTDTARAVEQWQKLHDLYLELGHEVELIEPLAGYPDMVYTANGGFLIDNRAYVPKFRFVERQGEAPAFADWFRAAGYDTVIPEEVNEGEGDFLLVGDVILAGTGFRSTGDSHREVGEVFGREVVSLNLVDPRFYHLDTAIAVLDPVQGTENGGPSARTSRTSPERSTTRAARSSKSASPTRSSCPTKTAPCSVSTPRATATTSSSRRGRRASRRSCASAATTRS
ncbi:Amidinotransferase [Microbacterium hydrocarbonoxydans]|uniref:Amidinotransferase n=1 Tax=Microbacterium hydrocarbonoxydans TaxID=273678 RepID=A0A1H4JF22_9MICO|nr:Amidinotransferase [Microbacterium hydrocarbonoxydans]